MEKLKNIKLIASDIDGTLINSKSETTKKTVEMIKKAHEQGIKFAICSGRPVSGITPLLKDWNLEEYCDYVIGMNGGEVLDRTNNKFITSYMLDEPTLKKLIKLYDAQGFITCYFDDTGLYVSRMSDDVINVATRTKSPVFTADIYEKTKGPQTKLMMIVEPERMDEIHEFYEKTKDESKYIGFKTAHDLFEINHPLLGKDVGVRIVAASMNIDLDNVLAFGDTTNDVPMLADLKHSVVMANGTQDAKDVAKYETLSCNDDGIAVFLEKYVL